MTSSLPRHVFVLAMPFGGECQSFCLWYLTYIATVSLACLLVSIGPGNNTIIFSSIMFEVWPYITYCTNLVVTMSGPIFSQSYFSYSCLRVFSMICSSEFWRTFCNQVVGLDQSDKSVLPRSCDFLCSVASAQPILRLFFEGLRPGRGQGACMLRSRPFWLPRGGMDPFDCLFEEWTFFDSRLTASRYFEHLA